MALIFRRRKQPVGGNRGDYLPIMEASFVKERTDVQCEIILQI
jgi:hypothetical protein